MKLLSGLALAAALAAVPAVAPARAEEGASIVIENFVFSPALLTVKAGTKVTFTNHDDLPHSVRDGNETFHSPALDTDETFAYIFETPGDIDYFCGLHPTMKGRITVTP